MEAGKRGLKTRLRPPTKEPQIMVVVGQLVLERDTISSPSSF